MKKLLVLALVLVVLISGCMGGSNPSEKTQSPTMSESLTERSESTANTESGSMTETTTGTSPEGAFFDDFTDLDTARWFVGEWETNRPAYDKVRIEDGVLVIPVEETDRGPYLASRPIEVNRGDIVVIERKALVHYGNEYFQGELMVYQTNYSGITPPSEISGHWTSWFGSFLFGIHYYHYYEPQENYVPVKDGFALTGPDWRDSGNYVTTEPVWDEWFTERIVYNTENGRVTYYLNGKEVGSVRAASYSSKYVRLFIHSYGWYTGHYTKMDWIKVSVEHSGSETSVETTTSTETETPTEIQAPQGGDLFSAFTVKTVDFGGLRGVAVEVNGEPTFRNVEPWFIGKTTYEVSDLSWGYFAVGNVLYRVDGEGLKNRYADGEDVTRSYYGEAYVLPAEVKDVAMGIYANEVFFASPDGKLYLAYDYEIEDEEEGDASLWVLRYTSWVSWDIAADGVTDIASGDYSYVAWKGDKLYVFTYSSDDLYYADEKGLNPVQPRTFTLPGKITGVFRDSYGDGLIIRAGDGFYYLDTSGGYGYGQWHLYTLSENLPGEVSYNYHEDIVTLLRDGKFYWLDLGSRYDDNDELVPYIDIHGGVGVDGNVQAFSLMYNTYVFQLVVALPGELRIYNATIFWDEPELVLDQAFEVPFTAEAVYGEDYCYCHINRYDNYFYLWAGNTYYALIGPNNGRLD
ncbi:hypothetical protein [Thermococcus sp. ES12]|uniref:hypothetical protein n=1 Tax=Thermococcus sp. ES12 TaxID=1638246 RepID=UPI001431E583|nr:hypothetical protein [Thermococcus sp. ES12]NJE75893.1 hypothetical protein [Thermococcus sp. ES12]